MSNDTLSVREAANLLGKDASTVRYLIEHGLVPWGISFRREGNRRRSYLIYRSKFEADTGIKIPLKKNESEVKPCKILQSQC